MGSEMCIRDRSSVFLSVNAEYEVTVPVLDVSITVELVRHCSSPDDVRHGDGVTIPAFPLIVYTGKEFNVSISFSSNPEKVTIK